jgi:negative regulator of flagellin synthesis FlgM
MNGIESARPRSTFFPNDKKVNNSPNNANPVELTRNIEPRVEELNKIAKDDVKIQIPDAVKDFARIKSAVDKAPDIDKKDQIARLKDQIASGKYNIDYEGLADKMLATEF